MANGQRSGELVRLEIDAKGGSILEVADPDGFLAQGDSDGNPPQLDRGDDLIGGRVDPGDRVGLDDHWCGRLCSAVAAREQERGHENGGSDDGEQDRECAAAFVSGEREEAAPPRPR